MSSLRPTDASFSRRRLIVNVFLIFGMMAGVAVVLDRLADAGRERGVSAPAASASAAGEPPVVAALPEPPARSALGEAPPVLALPGDFPDQGPGRFRFAGGESGVLGESGALQRFRVAVEEGLAEDPAEVAAFVTETLGDQRGWTADGELRLRRVPRDSAYDFTIYVATTGTAARLCAAAGLDVVGDGLPDGGVSCRTPGKVVLNLTRWRLSVPHYVEAAVPLEVYRQMLVNHEVGHELGYGHEACPDAGEPAPVMQQQSIDLAGCEANPWPYLGGERYAGTEVP